jgi:hemerythrin-like domain-containing protein
MEEIKPLKRSKELTPLSREHHEGLLFVWKIKQGLANQTPLETLCNYTRWFWANHFKSHFKNEESLLVKYLPVANPLVKQMFKEHELIKNLVFTLDKEPDEGSLKLLVEYINNHIRFEERQLFPFAETTLTPEQLDEVYRHLPSEQYCDAAWTDEFWAKK